MSRLILKEGSDTGTPATGYVSVYPKTDGRLYYKDDNGTEVEIGTNSLATGAGTGITAGTGTVYASSRTKTGGIYETTILIDLTGLNSKNTDGDIIGVDGTANPCHIGRITAADSGTILSGTMECLETPAGGDPNINLYSATEGTGVEDGLITDLTETLLYDRAGDWAAGDKQILTALPAANEYLYLTQGDATGTDATYTAGIFRITLLGT